MSHPRSPLVGPSATVPVLLLFAVCITSANACSVPVFRYALEHWLPDPYVAVVFHRGALSDGQQSLIEQLQPTGDGGDPIANLIVKTVDLDQQQSEVVLELWQQHGTETLPLVSLQTPPKLGPPQTAWFGELTTENVAGLIDSPARQAIREKLLSGDSVVWVFLESGEQIEDETAFTQLTEELARLQDVIELPPIEEQDLGELSVDPEALKIAFSTIRVSRDDELERPLIEMLLRVEQDLRDESYIHQAMAFPVFARGRTLYALVGDGITPETIEDASRFLTGACQCTVKAQNPGVDLLMAVDWEQFVQPALPYDDTPPPLAGLTNFAIPKAEVQSSPKLPSETEATPGPSADHADPPSDVPNPSVTAAETVDDATLEQTTGNPTETRAASSARVEESLARNITLFLGLMCAGVVAVTLIVVTRK